MTTTKIQLSYAELIDVAEQVIDEEGESYIYTENYPLCDYYTGSGVPMCLVGRMFDRMGVVSFDDYDLITGQGISDVLTALRSRDRVSFGWDTRKFLTTLQEEQDRGTTWGEALLRAKASVKSDPRCAIN